MHVEALLCLINIAFKTVSIYLCEIISSSTFNIFRRIYTLFIKKYCCYNFVDGIMLESIKYLYIQLIDSLFHFCQGYKVI